MSQTLRGAQQRRKEAAMFESRQSKILPAALLLALLAGVSPTHGQELTERFIPIGQSPGLSGKVTAIGTVQSMQGRMLTVGSDRGMQKFEVTDRCIIWVDRSQQKLTNTRGSVADLQAGRRVEVKPEVKNKAAAQWVKVEAPGG
jgi:hypothetical protein